MNLNTMQGDMKKLFGKIKEKWGELTDDDLVETEGKLDKLSGLIQKRYGESQEKAKEELKKLGVNS